MTHIQHDEIEAIDLEKVDKKKKLLQVFKEINAGEIPTESFVLNRSRLGKTKLSDGQLFTRLQQDNLKNIEDALVAESAIQNQIVLVTNDSTLLKRVKSLGGEAINFEQFLMKNEYSNE